MAPVQDFNTHSLVQDVRARAGDWLGPVLDASTLVGGFVLLLLAARLLVSLVQAWRLYVWSQWGRPGDLRAKYGDWALISGATDGIGLAMAKVLAQRGHSIVVVGRNEAKLASAKAALKLEPNSADVVTVQVDLSDSSLDNFERARKLIEPDKRRIGILVNNAGVFQEQLGRFEDTRLDELRASVNVNNLAALYLTRMVLPSMVSHGRGLVVNVSSIYGYGPGPHLGAYGPTKSFLNMFSKMLALENSARPVDVINLAPGFVQTKMSASTTNPAAATSWFNPTPDEYARSAVNALSTGIGVISGTATHALVRRGHLLVGALGLSNFVLKIHLRLVSGYTAR